MRIKRAAPVEKARIELIPMIDTMAFLLVFFMIASLAMSQQQGLKVDVPQVTSASPQTWGDRALVVTVDAHGRYFLNKQSVPWSKLGPEVRARVTARPEAIVVVNADRNLRHGIVTRVMSTVQQAGARHLVIATGRADEEWTVPNEAAR